MGGAAANFLGAEREPRYASGGGGGSLPGSRPPEGSSQVTPLEADPPFSDHVCGKGVSQATPLEGHPPPIPRPRAREAPRPRPWEGGSQIRSWDGGGSLSGAGPDRWCPDAAQPGVRVPLLPASEPGVSQPKCGHMTTGTPRRLERMEGRQFLALVAGGRCEPGRGPGTGCAPAWGGGLPGGGSGAWGTFDPKMCLLKTHVVALSQSEVSAF